MKFPSLPFDEVFADQSGGNVKTPTSEYLAEGKYPIIDQGKDFIAGFTNDSSRICGNGKSAIIFGDHTRCVKFVDFPFCIGADGVKVLRLRVEADLKYLYYALKYIDIPNAGYDRHFKYLKRKEIPLPSVPEQRRIAEILDKAEALRAKRRSALAKLDTLAQSIFLDMFGDPISNSNKFPVKPLVTLVDSTRGITYGVVQRGADEANGVAILRITDVVSGRIELSRVKFVSRTISNQYRRTILRGGEIVISIRGTVGRCALVPDALSGGNITRELALIPNLDREFSSFLLEFLRSEAVQTKIGGEVKGIAQRGINLEDLRELAVIIPPRADYIDFAHRIEAIEALKERHRTSLAKLEALFASLQHRAFRGEL